MRIQAAISREGARRPSIETVDLEDPKPGEILVRSVASGICHTDLGVHARPGPKPIVLGHEGAGIVERVGPGVTQLVPGDHVVMSVNYCGQCPNCLRNAHSYCYDVMPRNFGGLRPDGTSPVSQDGQRVFARFFGQSSFASYVLADAHAAVKVPKDLPLEILGPLGCGITTGAGAVINSFKLAAGQSIAVFGSGAVGLSAVMAAKLVGAVRIVAVDVVPERLDLALELGATDVVNSATTDPVEAIKKLTRYGVDFSFNTTRLPAVFTQAVTSLAPLGVAGFVAAPPPGTPWTPDLFQLLSGGRTLRGILGGDSSPQVFIPMLIDYYRQGRMPFDRLMRFYPFAEIGQAFEDIETGRTVKPVLRFS
jgi:aryl-alcohol dehydrogenase